MKKLITIILLIAWGSASAMPVTWKLNNVTFDDGRSAVGTFTYDADTNTYSDSNIKLIPKLGSWPWETVFKYESHIHSQVPVVNTAQHAIFTYDEGAPGDAAVLIFHFENPLTNNGDETTIRLNDPFFPGYPLSQESGWHYTYKDGPLSGLIDHRSAMVSGTVSVVPIPAAVWLFASGLGVLGWLRKRTAC